MIESPFKSKKPVGYNYIPFSWDSWVKAICSEANLYEVNKKDVIINRACKSLDRYLSKPVTKDEIIAAKYFNSNKIKDYRMHRYNMTKLQYIYLLPIFLDISKYIIGEMSKEQLRQRCRGFYYDALK